MSMSISISISIIYPSRTWATGQGLPVNVNVHVKLWISSLGMIRAWNGREWKCRSERPSSETVSRRGDPSQDHQKVHVPERAWMCYLLGETCPIRKVFLVSPYLDSLETEHTVVSRQFKTRQDKTRERNDLVGYLSLESQSEDVGQQERRSHPKRKGPAGVPGDGWGITARKRELCARIRTLRIELSAEKCWFFSADADSANQRQHGLAVLCLPTYLPTYKQEGNSIRGGLLVMSLDGKKKKKLCWSVCTSTHSNHRKVCCGCNSNCTVELQSRIAALQGWHRQLLKARPDPKKNVTSERLNSNLHHDGKGLELTSRKWRYRTVAEQPRWAWSVSLVRAPASPIVTGKDRKGNSSLRTKATYSIVAAHGSQYDKRDKRDLPN
ncbi:Uncharacterized protein Y057_8893 [Fusarium fujikuroi]|nr:Uncharacterized protein Y057_8893 [Fusarium fujikuroi]